MLGGKAVLGGGVCLVGVGGVGMGEGVVRAVCGGQKAHWMRIR